MADHNDKTRIITPETDHNDATILSVTELEQIANAKPSDDDATRVLATPDLASATMLSPTAVQRLKTQVPDPDATALLQADPSLMIDDATVAINSDQATVLAGGTQAIRQQATAEYSPHIQVGSVIKDRFKLEKLLGRGGMGEVYLATDKRKLEAQDKNPYVAVKVLGENFKRHPQAFIALQREARKTQELAHPNIVTVYDFDRQGDTVYLTMEALSGKPMDEEIRSDVRPLAEACRMITQCSEGLAYAHKKGLVHSDLKPGNLFLTAEGNVKLLDFGIARAFKSGKDLANKAANTKDDTVFDAGELGALTPAYATCEMLEGAEPHPSDDVYALGLIAYELLTGKHPFNKQMATKAEAAGLKPERIKGLTKQQWLAIEHALAFRRSDRTQDAQAFLAQFTAKSKTPLYIAAAAILVAFIGVGSLSLFVEPEIGPAIAFNELPQETQQRINTLRSDAQMLEKFQDYNSALSLLNEAFTLHPYNQDVMAQLDLLVKTLLAAIANGEPAVQLRQIESLLKYESLKENKQLLDKRKTLQ